MAHLFPIFLSLSGKKCLVVGGGQVAERKIADLLECEANVNVISPTAGDLIRLWSNQGLINWQAREIIYSDLDNIFLAFVATNNMHTNQMVVNWCRERGIMVNAVDDPPNCDFYVPAVVRRNSLVVAISTEGKSPMFSRKLREQLEGIIGEEYGEFVDFLGEQRECIKQAVTDIKERKKIFEALADSDILDLLKAGERERAKERMEQCMSSWQD
ncbi:MAG TPA: siroheme synthase [Syntrophomonas sp.]|jgi:precorrin-2 dehydrogenase/sirohydrochlorin ferrochelatase|nr:siroheme synthase [Syntrophomonas sp.]